MAEAVRVLTREGVLYATEVFNAGVYTYPPRVALMEYWKHFNQLQSDFGGHPDIGIQLANLALEDVRKVQIAGLVNYGLNNDGLQVALFLNVARKHSSGVQIAGFINYATYLHGLQLGLINVCNIVERGVPIGIFSYVQDGYHMIEIS